MGFAASVVSDSVSNSIRVVKTYRQVHATRIAYLDAARAIVALDGVRGLFGRGLKTRILANGLQSIMFSILWKLFLDLSVWRIAAFPLPICMLMYLSFTDGTKR